MTEQSEWQFIVDYVKDSTTDFCNATCRSQLMALWTAYCMHNDLLLSLGADSHAKKLINDALAEMTDGICEFAQGYMRADLQLVVAALKATVDALEAVLNDDDKAFADDVYHGMNIASIDVSAFVSQAKEGDRNDQ